MENLQYWDSSPVSELSDLDTVWSPESGFSDQENFSEGTGSSSSRPKSRCPVKRVQQRRAANQRERKRMKTINEAFEGLRERIPLAGGERKLSKVDTLKLAIRYIHQLADLMSTVGPASQGYQCNSQQAENKVIIRCHNPGMSGGYYGQEQDQYLYGHSLSWVDEKQPKIGPNNKLVAKVWMPEPQMEYMQQNETDVEHLQSSLTHDAMMML